MNHEHNLCIINMKKMLVITIVFLVIIILSNSIDVVGVPSFGKFVIHFAISRRTYNLDIYICSLWPGKEMTHRKPD